MKTKILKLLRKADGYVSGQQICEQLDVSRTAVWKVIRQLKEEGYQIEAVRNRGYRIVEVPDVLTGEELKSLMQTQWAGRNIVCYPETDSTNLRIRELGDAGAPRYSGCGGHADGRKRKTRTYLGISPGIKHLHVDTAASGYYSGGGAHAHSGDGLQCGGRNLGL